MLSEGRDDKFGNYEHNSSLDHASDNGTEEASKKPNETKVKDSPESPEKKKTLHYKKNYPHKLL